MAIRVQNTLTGRKDEFVAAPDKRVRIYVCGVTPYDETHIGHARPSVFWDVVRRYLEYRGLQVFLVQNFTDIDDKVIARAQATGEDPLSVSRRYSDQYRGLMDRLGVERPDVGPRVSDHIGDIIELIRGLVDKGVAYARDGNVWFAVHRCPDYGKLSRRSQDELLAGARVEPDASKDNPADFALWKRARPGEPSWPSPWGPGRPGWHIECSAMALKYLGPDFDFHGGGTDLIFPHHENEIAQSEAYTGRPFCRMWLHNAMLNLRGEKMSKSLGNTVILREVLGRAPGGAVRLLLLGAHYRKALDFDFELLEDNRRAWRRLNEAVQRLRGAVKAAAPVAGCPDRATASGAGPAPPGDGLAAVAAVARRRFEEAMDDDFNTAGALAALFDLARRSNAELGGTSDSGPVGAAAALEVMEELGRGVLGVVEPPREDAGQAAPAGAERLLELILEIRSRARAEKSYALSDYIRDALIDLGYEVRDTVGRTVAKRRE